MGRTMSVTDRYFKACFLRSVDPKQQKCQIFTLIYHCRNLPKGRCMTFNFRGGAKRSQGRCPPPLKIQPCRGIVRGTKRLPLKKRGGGGAESGPTVINHKITFVITLRAASTSLSFSNSTKANPFISLVVL